MRTSLHLFKPEQNLTQYSIFVAINKANWYMEGDLIFIFNGGKKKLSPIKARMSKGTRLSTAVAIVTHELQRNA